MRATIKLDRRFNKNNLTIVAWCYDEYSSVILRRFYKRKRPADMTEFYNDVLPQVTNELRTLNYEVIE